MTRADPMPIALEDIAAKTCTGDVRDFLMQWGRTLQKPWPQMSQTEQEMFRDACTRQAENIVRGVTRVVGAQDHLAFEASTRDFNRKGDRLEAKITLPYSLSNLEALARASDAGPIVLAVVSLDDYRGERRPAQVMKDQPNLYDGEVGVEGEGEAAAAAGDGTDDDVGSADAGGQGGAAGDTVAAQHQGDALSEAERAALGPEPQDNADRLAGIKTLKPGDAEPLAPQPEGAPKRRGRLSVDERTAANAAAAEQGDRQTGQQAQ